jgi:abortive infection bacteriophage resistance protein
MMQEKSFKTHDELVNILISRGIEINDDSDLAYAKRVLERNGYYNLINGYSKLFVQTLDESGQPTYRPGTTLDEIHALYQFDRVLRNIFFRYILEVEANIKSLISYSFSEVHGHKNYLIYSNFNVSLKDSNTKITSLISEIQRQLASRSTDPSISHYLNKYGYVPLWVLNNILTLGTISKFYSLMLPSERQSVSRHFGIMDNELENCLLYISSIRNFCAHGNRLYCFRTKHPLSNTSYHEALNIPKNSSGEFISGKRDLFACVIALKRLLSHNDYKRMSKEIFQAIGTLDKKLSVLSREDVLNEMGFPSNWRALDSL